MDSSYLSHELILDDIDEKTKSDLIEFNNTLNPALIYSVVQLANFLREKEFEIPPSSIILFCKMIEHFNIFSKKDYLSISKSLFCKTKLDFESYNCLFDEFFSNYKERSLGKMLEAKKHENINQITSLENELSDKLSKHELEIVNKRKDMLSKILNSKYKSFNAHKKMLQELTDEDLNELDNLIEKTDSTPKEKQLLKALITIDKDILNNFFSECYVGDTRYFNNGKMAPNSEELVSNIASLLEKIMMLNFENKDIEAISSLMIDSAATLSKINKEYASKGSSIDNEFFEFKKSEEQRLDEFKQQCQNEISALKYKITTSKHRPNYVDGKNAVVELIRNSDRTITSLNKNEYKSLLYYISMNAPKFRTRLGNSLKKSRNKQFDVKKTIEESVKFNGVPMKFYYKKPVVKKYKLVCVLDISGSVSKYLEILSSFLFEVNTVFNGGISVYGFVSNLMDFTDVFKSGNLKDAVEAVKGYRGYSSYEKAIHDLYDKHYKEIDKNTIILYFGDARNNKNKSAEEYLKKINSKAMSVWLNPEVKSKWNSGDSIMNTYSRCVDETYCVNTIDGLINFLNTFDGKKKVKFKY